MIHKLKYFMNVLKRFFHPPEYAFRINIPCSALLSEIEYQWVRPRRLVSSSAYTMK